MRSLRLFILAGLVAGCATGPRAGTPPRAAASRAADGEASARAAIAAASREFSARYERGDAAGMVALYTPDGVIFPPGRPALQGPAGLLAYWTLSPGLRVLEHRVTSDSVVLAGPVAYDWGTYRVRTRQGEGPERETHGKYVIVWREAAPGTWRMRLDIWNGNPPPGSPPPGR